MRFICSLLGAAICFAQSSVQLQGNRPLANGPTMANAATGQPFATTTVSGRPFFADAVFETDQTLPDGSHIVNQQSLSAARDSQGRTYREEVLAAQGVNGPAPKTISIGDPVAKVNYVLGPDRIAHKLPMSLSGSEPGALRVSTSSMPQASVTLQRFRTAAGGGRGPVLADGQAAPQAQQIPAEDTKLEQLGTQVIAGFEADGTRITLTIPVGQVRNQNPILITSERWYSQDLQVTMLAKYSDPRVGTSSYQLTNIQQIEPPASLFQIPSGYSIEEDQ